MNITFTKDKNIIPKILYQIKENYINQGIMPFEEDKDELYTLTLEKNSGYIEFHLENRILLDTLIREYINYSLEKNIKLPSMFKENTIIIIPYELGEKLDFIEDYHGLKIHYSKYLSYICNTDIQRFGIKNYRFEITSNKKYLMKYAIKDII